MMNWGTKIIIGMGLFMAFIVAMGTKMILSTGGDDLVEKDYYEKGLAYDKDYNEQKKAVNDSVIPDFSVEKNGLAVLFKSPAKYKLTCKRFSDSKLDRVFEGYTDVDGRIMIPAKELKRGLWQLYLEFIINEKEYLVERKITMP